MFLKYTESWHTNVNAVTSMTGNGRNKLRAYKLFKSEYGVENDCKVSVPFNLVGPRKNFPIRSILSHINEFTPLATYNLPLCVINWGPAHVTHDGCVGDISTNTCR
jgi:hypothetical protein